jgi:DNA replication protein DnaC
MEAVREKMKTLRLSGAILSLESRNRYALDNKCSYLEFLEMLLEDECVRRKNNSFDRKLKASRMDPSKTLDVFDFRFQPDIDKRQIQELASCRFIGEKQNIIFMGKPGVGKTHLANAIGMTALQQGYEVMLVHANTLIDDLYRHKADGRYQAALRKYKRLDLLIIDELGFKRIPRNGLDDFFDVIRGRYEKGSIIITTNRTFEDWGGLFEDPVMASAIIDRLIHHAEIIKITGNSYRIKKRTELIENDNKTSN